MKYNKTDKTGDRIGNWLIKKYVKYEKSQSIYECLHKPCGTITEMRTDRLYNAINKDGCCPVCNPKGEKRSIAELKKRLCEQTTAESTALLRMMNDPGQMQGSQPPAKKRKLSPTEKGKFEAWKYSRGLV